MPVLVHFLGTILENLSGRKLSILVSILLVFQVACFLIGGLIAPPPASSQGILSTVCIDTEPDSKDQNRWFAPNNCRRVNLHQDASTAGLNANNLVFVIKMPLYGMDFSRWQQNLVGVLQIDMIYKSEQTLQPLIELTLDAKLAYR